MTVEVKTGTRRQFYETLGSGKSIKQSFDSARAKIASRYGDQREIGEFRSISFGELRNPSMPR